MLFRKYVLAMAIKFIHSSSPNILQKKYLNQASAHAIIDGAINLRILCSSYNIATIEGYINCIINNKRTWYAFILRQAKADYKCNLTAHSIELDNYEATHNKHFRLNISKNSWKGWRKKLKRGMKLWSK